MYAGDYQLISAAIKRADLCQDDIVNLVSRLIVAFEHTNPLFDRNRFMVGCDLSDDEREHVTRVIAKVFDASA